MAKDLTVECHQGMIREAIKPIYIDSVEVRRNSIIIVLKKIIQGIDYILTTSKQEVAILKRISKIDNQKTLIKKYNEKYDEINTIKEQISHINPNNIAFPPSQRPVDGLIIHYSYKIDPPVREMISILNKLYTAAVLHDQRPLLQN